MASLFVDGVSLAPSESYTFINVIKDRSIHVNFSPIDSLPPVITILGDNPMNINTGDEFIDPGATAVDAVTGESLEVTTSGFVNVGMNSSSEIVYSATDSFGNTATAKRIVNVSDISAPIISQILIPVKTSTVAVITWMTDEPATSQIYYGLNSGALDKVTALDDILTVNHVVTLSSATLDDIGNTNELIPDTTYYYKILSIDDYGNESESEEMSFKTEIVIQEAETKYIYVGGGGNNNDTTAPVDRKSVV